MTMQGRGTAAFAEGLLLAHYAHTDDCRLTLFGECSCSYYADFAVIRTALDRAIEAERRLAATICGAESSFGGCVIRAPHLGGHLDAEWTTFSYRRLAALSETPDEP